MNNKEINLNQLLLEKNMLTGALEGLAAFVSDHISKENVLMQDVSALHGLIYGIQLMAEAHGDNLDKYELKLIDEKRNK